MEYVTSSAGIQTVFSNYSQQIVLKPISSATFTNSAATSSYTVIPNLRSTAGNSTIGYGSSFIAANDANKENFRSSSAANRNSMIIIPKRRRTFSEYDSLNDPHLRDFYERKFKMSSAKKYKSTTRKPGPNEVVYRVKVKTGNYNNAGTDANVFVTICGNGGELAKKRLFNKYNAMRAKEGYKFKFERNSTNTFKLIGADVGQLTHIVVEHDGKDLVSSWYLQEVVVTNTKTNRSWLFEFNDWLSLDHGLGKTKIQLIPTRELDKYKKTNYKVIVITGDRPGASTDANVYLTLTGMHRTSPRVKLENTDKNIFQRGKTDVFKLNNLLSVGQLKKIRIEHDNTGKSPGWYVDRIVITDAHHPDVNYYAICNQWLDKDKDDGQTSRDLEVVTDLNDIRREGKYKVTVFTGDKRASGTDANVFVQMYGSLGNTENIKLDNKENNFERGKKDEFIISCLCVGEIKKIRIGHDNNGANPGWYLNKIIIDDLILNRVYEFGCDRWLAEDEGDGKTSVILYPAQTHGHKVDETVPYILYIHTGDVRNAGTNSKVYVEMFGGKDGQQSSGRMFVEGQYERGNVDKIPVEASKMLAPVSKIIIGHDNSGIAPGWFLDRVELETPSIGMKQVFPCEKWLAKDKEDGKIQRTLKENTSLRQTHKAQDVWNIRFYTSDIKNAGTDARVFVTIYGDQGKTDQLSFREKAEHFERGKMDEFKIESARIGKPYKLRVWHDNNGAKAGWHLDQIELENVNTKERYFFVCRRWLAEDEEDGEIVRELPAEGDSVKKPLPIVNYQVEVHTGKKSGGGTDSDVFINIFGELGDTGERFLKKTKSHKNKFERGQVDVFNIEAVTLKALKKIRIGHNGKRAGAGWFLDKVVVKQEGNPKYDQTFECNRWLAVDEDDGLIVRELFAEKSQYLDTTTYNVKVKTGDKRNAGTDARVTLKIFGRKGDTGDRHLIRSDTTDNKFERGRVDEFKIEGDDIGKIEKIRIGHNGKGLGSGWFLDYVEVDVPSKGIRYKFSAHRWLDENEGDGQTVVELFPTEETQIRNYMPYVVTIKTGDKRGSGTDANVFIQFYGLDGKTEEYPLKTNSNNFERGKEETFKIEADDVGPIYKVRIGHDNKGSSSGWFLEKMIVQRHAHRDSKRLRKSSRSGSRSSLRDRDRDSDVENYYFFVNKWFAKDEDDGQVVRELTPTDENGRPLIGLDEVEYDVHVYTGDVRGAGTDANVFINIYGQNGDSGERELQKSNKMNKFERNQCDTFKVKAIELGELSKVRIRHDNKGGGAAWYLEKVEIYNPNTDRLYLFNCQDWLSKNEGDGRIERELLAIDPQQLKKVHFRQGAKNLKDQFLLETEALTTTYNITVVTSDIANAGTDSRVYIQLFGDKQDSGKLPLNTSKNNKNKFERGNSDIFEVKEADVGDIRKIRIGHDGRGMGSGWHLKEVIIDAPKLGKKWRFPCGRWLDKNEDDGKTERELFPMNSSFEEYTPYVPYEIVVYTSDLRGADTSANPYIVIYGEEIRTQQTELCKNKAERRDKFKRGGIDRFVLELDDVGKEITKIRIGHDNKGMSAGWHVDKVEIRRLKQSGKGSKIFVFPCNRWLARDEDDKAIERDLIPAKVIDEKFQDGEIKTKEKDVKQHLEIKDYLVDVFTGDVSGAGTDSNVFLTLFGEFGDSGEKKLIKSLTHMNKFERKNVDRFVIQSADLGPIFKVHVRHDNSSFSNSWFLDRIEVNDKKDKYVFLCERWLSKSKEDKLIERTLFEKNYRGPRNTSTSSFSLKSNIGSSQFTGSHSKIAIREQSHSAERMNDYDGPTVPYKITIRTGDEKNCGISSQVFIRLFGPGKKQKTDKMMLKLAKKNRFEPGSLEIFMVEAPDIGELRQIELGHDGVGPKENWFVKNVEVIDTINGRVYNIKCNEWLGTEKGDGLTVKRFNVDDATTSITSFRGKIPYTMTIYTGDVQSAGTDSNVTFKFFGEKNASSDIVVEKLDDRFERASVDTVVAELEDIGNLKKVRVTHDGKGSRKEWFLSRIEMTNMKTKKQYVFVYDNWLAKGGKGLSVDIPVLDRKGRESIVGTDYRISVKTSDLLGAGTDANVFLTLFGANGDSGELELKKSETNRNKFERGKTDVFVFNDILSLGELSKLRIRHDNTGSLVGNTHWHLESVEVQDLRSQKAYTFLCNKWLSKSKDDGQLVRELTTQMDGNGSQTPRRGDRTEYEITIYTADEQNAGTKQNVELVLIGDKNAESKPLLLENTAENKILRRGHKDKVVIKSKSIGDVKKVLLCHVESQQRQLSREERNAAWICEKVTVKDLGTGNTYVIPVMDALMLNKPPKTYKCEEKKENQVNLTRSLKNIQYEVYVVTADEKGAGTGAHVLCTMYGEHGDSGKRQLKGKFDRNHTDKCIIECLDLGKLEKIHIEHDNSSFNKDWLLDRVEVVNTSTQEKTVFPCNKWLSKNKEDREIERDLYPLMDDEEKRRSKSDLRSPKLNLGNHGLLNRINFESNNTRKELNEYNEYFKSQRGFDEDERRRSRGSSRRNSVYDVDDFGSRQPPPRPRESRRFEY